MKQDGKPFLPYGRQWIDEADIKAVVEALRSDWLTTGPQVDAFEAAVAAATGARYGVAVSSGTAALHCAMAALGVGPGDEVIVPPLTFAATANAVAYLGGTPVFADVDPETLLLDPEAAAQRITPKTKGVLAVDYAGQPCDYAALRALTDRFGLFLAADACHSLGGSFQGRPVGSLADVSALSFHPVKHITTGEGGMTLTDNEALALRAKRFRNHGIDRDHRLREQEGDFAYHMEELGFNYRLTDMQCALGRSQLGKLGWFIERRTALAAAYDRSLADLPLVHPLCVRPDVRHAWHLYVVRIDFQAAGLTRREAFRLLREAGIGANVHYLPVYLHPWYQRTYGTCPGLCPVAEAAYASLLSLPLHPAMELDDVTRVTASLSEILLRAQTV